MTISVQVNVFQRGSAGIPTTTHYQTLQAQLDSIQWSSSDTFGFESMTCSFRATLEEALDWLTQRLMYGVVVSGPEAEIVWEGFINTIEVAFGTRRHSSSLDGTSNRVRVRYTTVLGTPGVTATTSDTDSQTLYGIKDGAFTLGTSDSTEAGHYRDSMLADLANPAQGPSATLQTGELGEIVVTLSCVGWYGTLDWVLTSNTSTTKTTTTTQVGTLLTNIAAVNAFLSTSTTNITASGITAVETILDDTPYREKIESLLKRGNGANRYAWGVYEDREFYAAPYAGADPTDIDYEEYLGDSNLYDSNGAVIFPWNARPNRMFQTIDLLDIAPVSGAKDSAARFYVARVTCGIGAGQITLTLEPAGDTDLAAILVTKYV